MSGFCLPDTDSVCVHETTSDVHVYVLVKFHQWFSPVASSSDDRYCSVFALAVVDSLFTESSPEVKFSSELK